MNRNPILIIVLLFGFVFIAACKDDNNSINTNTSLNIEGQLIFHSACKKNNDDFQSNEIISKVDYQYDASTNSLTLTHQNVRFNCCPHSLNTDIFSLNDTIFIKEYEVNGNCRCTCLYDLNMLITGVEPQKYTIKITEPNQIVFDINLKKNTSGSFNVLIK